MWKNSFLICTEIKPIYRENRTALHAPDAFDAGWRVGAWLGMFSKKRTRGTHFKKIRKKICISPRELCSTKSNAPDAWHSAWHIVRHGAWHTVWHPMWHAAWHPVWHGAWHHVWHGAWHTVWHTMWHVSGKLRLVQGCALGAAPGDPTRLLTRLCQLFWKRVLKDYLLSFNSGNLILRDKIWF